MALYYFDIIDNGIINRDEFGVDLADGAEAREQAQALLPDIARSGLPDGEYHTFVCEVRNTENCIIYRGCLTYHGEYIGLRDGVMEQSTDGRD